ncbi:hypothetical protein AVEN_25383-1 [Araneus ventricosus]|uniref:Uncharacterized protein n=1 Tax=Araneus ventricosus TaxID=182803 RepID=A0A4Y2EF44_ARAVE|nr:hypothetical protein AVEN_25383-1 [Araneus ventricosus]
MYCEDGCRFPKNAVVHLSNGHAYARVLRAHSLSQVAIGLLILEYCEENGFLRGSDVEALKGIQNEVIKFPSSEEYFLSKVNLLMSAISIAVKRLEERSRTVKLWLQYFKVVSVMHDFVRAKRTGNWNLHFYSVQPCLFTSMQLRIVITLNKSTSTSRIYLNLRLVCRIKCLNVS